MRLLLLENHNTRHVNPEQQQLIESIKEDSDRLLKITGELLNMSQVGTGNIQLNYPAVKTGADPGICDRSSESAGRTKTGRANRTDGRKPFGCKSGHKKKSLVAHQFSYKRNPPFTAGRAYTYSNHGT